jgi:AcrR family transcriptional regulator
MTAAAQVLVRHGYDQATTGLVAAQAGVSIGTLYQYYPNKDAVFSELLRREFDAITLAVGSALATAAPDGLRGQVRAAVGALFAAKAGNPRLHHVLSTELGRLDGARLLKEMNHRTRKMTEAGLSGHGDAVRFANPDRAAFLVVNVVEGIILATLAEAPETLADPELANEVADLVVAFLETPRRRDPRSP